MWQRLLVTIAIAALAIAGAQACATKKFVRTNVAEINGKVDSLGRSVEATQERVRQNDTRISQVGQQTQNATQAAQRANSTAQQASAEAAQAQTKVSTIGSTVERMEKESKKLVDQVVLDDTEGNFKFGDAALPPEAMHRIDDLVTQLTRNPQDVYFEIVGYTDNVGNAAFNERLGLERAEAAEQYLHERFQIPLHKINVISYGENNPVAPNTNREGRAKNRRVVIRVVG